LVVGAVVAVGGTEVAGALVVGTEVAGTEVADTCVAVAGVPHELISIAKTSARLKVTSTCFLYIFFSF
jgi:hypothetical protein